MKTVVDRAREYKYT